MSDTQKPNYRQVVFTCGCRDVFPLEQQALPERCGLHRDGSIKTTFPVYCEPSPSSADTQITPETLREAMLQFMCPHHSKTGGNDYQRCTDCDLEWDYRRTTAEKQALNNLGEAVERAAKSLAACASPQETHAQQPALNELMIALKAIEQHCPCGARPESPHTHAHVGGCPVSKAIRCANSIIVADEYIAEAEAESDAEISRLRKELATLRAEHEGKE